MRKLTLFCIIALVALLVVPAYAEVQNVKVSGDLAARWIIRGDYDLDKSDNHLNSGSTYYSDAADDFLMSTTEAQVDADLTDNVSTVVRLVNQRYWGDRAGMATGSTRDNAMDLIVDLANVTLKELVYSPLTVTIGRQDLWFGKGFVIGAKQRDPNNALASGGQEYTAINSFDAIKGTLDFDPWKIDGIYTLIEENTLNKADDVWLTGANLGYKFSSYNGEGEAYMFYKKDNSKSFYPHTTVAVPREKTWMSTYGMRGSFEPVANATIAAEGALQYGRYSVTTANAARKRYAYAWDVSGDYKFKDVKWTPKVGLELITYSGESSIATTDVGTMHGWDQLYRGKFDTAIREFQNLYYGTSMRCANHDVTDLDPDSGVTNEQQYILSGSINPINSLKVDGRFAWFRYMEAPTVSAPSGAGDRSKDIGSELDLSLTYDYTEDVSFGLLAAWFFPGKYWVGGYDNTASDIVGSVKVAF